MARYTESENAVLLQMAAAGHYCSDIAAEVGRGVDSVRKRLELMNVPVQHAPTGQRPEQRVTAAQCPRCTIIITATGYPAAEGGLCAWCAAENMRKANE